MAAVLGNFTFVNHNRVHAAGISASPLDDSSVAAVTSLDRAMEALAARVSPALVNIAVTIIPSAADVAQQGGSDESQILPPGSEESFDQGGSNDDAEDSNMQRQPAPLQHAIGSGVIISSDGYIVTNNHVVDGAKNIKVTLHDRRVLNGRVVGVDKMTDLAVVKVDAQDLPAAGVTPASLSPGRRY